MSSQAQKETDLNYLLGLDGIKPAGSRFLHVGKQYPYDHRHRNAADSGVTYEFNTASQLVRDFYAEVERILKELSQ